MNLFYQPRVQQGLHYLEPEESRHSTKVLRMKVGDRIQITDGKGFLYNALITKADVNQCLFDIQETVQEPLRNYHIHIGIAPTKNADRLEWFVEKAVELGVDEITLINCEHSERTHLKFERLQKIAISAMKQSLRSTLPSISGPVELTEIMHVTSATGKFIACVDPKNPNHLKDIATANSTYLVLIGPEGDFSKNELQMASVYNFQRVSLGSLRLRTETAGLVACHILNLVNTP